MSALLACRPNLEVVELAPTVRFLCDVLEFAVDMEDAEMGLAMLHRDEVAIAVVRAARPGVNETTACYLTVSAVEEIHAACVDHGAPIVVALTDRPWGLRDFVVELPGGHRIALGEPIN